jgi:hypothetical protein
MQASIEHIFFFLFFIKIWEYWKITCESLNLPFFLNNEYVAGVGVKYIFIDESGDLGEKGSKHMLLVAVIIDEKNKNKLEKVIKNIKRRKFKRELKKNTEIKTNLSSHELILYILNLLNDIELELEILVLNKKQIKKFAKDKHKIYNKLTGILIENIKCDTNLFIIIDRSKGKLSLQLDFNTYIMKKINSKHKIKILHDYSQNHIGLQIADIIAWSYFQKHEYENCKFTDIIDKKEIII